MTTTTQTETTSSLVAQRRFQYVVRVLKGEAQPPPSRDVSRYLGQWCDVEPWNCRCLKHMGELVER